MAGELAMRIDAQEKIYLNVAVGDCRRRFQRLDC